MEHVRYFLPPHVFVSATGHYVIVLNLRRDQYSCIPRQRFDPLAPWLSGWPAGEPQGNHSSELEPTPPVARQLAALATQGILTADPVESKPVCPVSIPRPATDSHGGCEVSVGFSLTALIPFLVACRRADSVLKTRRFEDIVAAITARRQSAACEPSPARRRSHDRPDSALDTGRAVRLAGIFAALRLFYARPLVCTLDSLALLEFLAMHRIYPHWIFGVRADPFHAHCWVQLGDTLLNDRIERVARLTPVMAA